MASDEICPEGQLLVYQGPGMDGPLNVRLEGETVWLSKKQLAELYGVTVPTINEHIATIYEDEEMAPEATIRKFRIVQTEGTRQVRRLIDHYSLEMIIAVGFRVRSRRGSSRPKPPNWTPPLKPILRRWVLWNRRSVLSGRNLRPDCEELKMDKVSNLITKAELEQRTKKAN